MFTEDFLYRFWVYLFLGTIFVAWCGGFSAGMTCAMLFLCFVGALCTWIGGGGLE